MGYPSEGYEFNQYERERLENQGEIRPTEERLNLGALGLCGEAGEFAELIKKHHFHGKPLDRQHALKELGDVLWYIMFCASTLGSSLEEVAQINNAKLRARYPNGWSVEAAAKSKGDKE
jgi:NTP pyrophosphatase (non-canonical NTP hydrolase)